MIVNVLTVSLSTSDGNARQDSFQWPTYFIYDTTRRKFEIVATMGRE